MKKSSLYKVSPHVYIHTKSIRFERSPWKFNKNVDGMNGEQAIKYVLDIIQDDYVDAGQSHDKTQQRQVKWVEM